MKANYEAVKRDSPELARKAIAGMANTGQAALTNLVSVLATICRQRRLAMENKIIELDYKSFVKHWEGRGRDEASAIVK